MLQLLQTGKMLYVLAAVCALGILSKLVTSRLYKRLIKETGNMALTKNKNLKALKQKTENMFLISHGIRNASAYIEKQIYGFRFMKISLDNWDNFSMQTMILCFLVGGIAAFASYWYRCDSYYIVLYGTMGILSGLFLVFVDNGANIAVKRQQLADCLVDYVENSPHFYKNVDKSLESADTEKKNKTAAIGLKPRLREVGRKNGRAVEETAAGGETSLITGKEEVEERTSRFHIERSASRADTEKTENAQNERPGSRFSVLSKKKESKQESISQEGSRAGARPDSSGEDELAKSIEQLRISLEQIAASREQIRRETESSKSSEKSNLERAKKDLKPEDLKLLGELLQEYLT